MLFASLPQLTQKVLTLLSCSTFIIGMMNTSYANATANQALVDRLSTQLQVHYKIMNNDANKAGIDCSALGADWGSCHQVELTLHNQGEAIADRHWQIYFHSIRLILRTDHPDFKIRHITGDLHVLEPSQTFTKFPANASVTIPIVAEYWQLFNSDVMPRWYVSAKDAHAKVIHNTDTEDVTQFMQPINFELWKGRNNENNVFMDASARFAKNALTTALAPAQLRGQILPTPLKKTIHQEDIEISQGLSFANVDSTILTPSSLAVIYERLKTSGIPINASGLPVQLSLDAKFFIEQEMQHSGAYYLHIDKEGIKIKGYDQAGVFYALQSLVALTTPHQTNTLPSLTIWDAPRFEYRGMHLDVGRNFKDKASVKRLLAQMSAYKLNKFHFHLSDDEGWRIEIPGLPELTEIGSKRCHDLTEQTCLLPQLGSGPDQNNLGSGFYSTADYIDILQYAAAHHIEVIPEIDMPAHARAAVIAMEARFNRLKDKNLEQATQYRLLDPLDQSNTLSVQFYDRHSYLNPCLPSTHAFVELVITEMDKLHKQAGVPLKTWHFGGDEAKNIRLGAGFQDQNAPEKIAGKGSINLSHEDHPWSKSPICQAMIADKTLNNIEELPSHFAKDVSKILAGLGIERMHAWQDGLKHVHHASEFAIPHIAVNFWDTLYWGGANSVQEWSDKGFQVILSNPDYLYFDMPYEANPSEYGYYWATRFSDEQKVFSFSPKNLAQNAETSVDRDGNAFTTKINNIWSGAWGISGQSWHETVRTHERMEYMIYPRLLALAERAWHQADWETEQVKDREYTGGKTSFVDANALHQDWLRFANLVSTRELARLDSANIQYRIPPPGIKVTDEKIHLNNIFPSLPLEYSWDGKNWHSYTQPISWTVKEHTAIWARTLSPDKKRYSSPEMHKLAR